MGNASTTASHGSHYLPVREDWLARPATREQLRAQGMTPVGGTPAAFAALVARDTERWAGVIERARISAE